MKKQIPLREYLSYGVGGLGKGVADAFVSTFILIYFTDTVGIAPIAGGAVITVSKILVMLLLPFAGMKMDKTKSKFGRFRPYLFWLSLILSVVTVITFLSPTLYGVRTAWAKTLICFVSYLLWETAYNLHDIPFWSIASVASDKEEIRSAFLAIANVITTVGGVIPILTVPYLLERFGDTYGYFYSALIFGISGGLLATASFFGTRERIVVEEKKVTARESFRVLFSNKPMLLFDAGLLLAATVFTVSEGATYVGNYLYGVENGKILYPDGTPSFLDEGLFLTLLIMLCGAGSTISDSVFPLIFKKTGMKKTYFITTACLTALCVVMFFFGYDKLQKWSIFVLLFYYLSMGFFAGMFDSLKSNLIPECTDYAEWKTGIRQDGTFFSVQVTVSQLIESVPVLLFSLVLQLSNYAEPVSDTVAVQPQSVKEGIFFAVTVLSCIGPILGMLPVAFYPYTGAFRKKVLAELQERRKDGE